MAATLLVPILITGFGLPADPAAALFGAGIGTLVYIFFSKKKSPVFLGSSFTFLGAYAASINQLYGYWGIIIGVVFAGLSMLSSLDHSRGRLDTGVNRLMTSAYHRSRSSP
jgi:uracil permease